MIGLGTIHPAAEDIAADVRELAALDLHGIKIHPDIQGYRIDDPLFFPALSPAWAAPPSPRGIGPKTGGLYIGVFLCLFALSFVRRLGKRAGVV